MGTRVIMIIAGSVTAEAELNGSGTAEKIWDALPIEVSANTWGDEIYFSIPVKDVIASGAKEVVAVGELGYWPPGSAFCIFFGMTPASRNDEIRPASAVNPLGFVKGEATAFNKVRDGEKVRLEKYE